MTTLTKMSKSELIIIFRTLCAVIIENSPNPYAVGYAEVGLSLTDLDAIEAQSLYILSNLPNWRMPAPHSDFPKQVRDAFSNYTIMLQTRRPASASIN
jgi:hypothetical protein